MMRLWIRWLVIVDLIIVLVSCDSSISKPSLTNTIHPTVTATHTSSPSPTSTPEPTKTLWLSETPTLEPTKTPIPPTPTPPAILGSLVVVFTRDEAVWVWRNGVETRLTEAPIESLDLLVNTNQIALSDDGQKIAFTRGDREIWSINIDGTEVKQLAGEDFFDALEVDGPYKMKWLPSSHILLFNTYAYRQTGYYEPSYDFHQVDADTGELKTIASAGNGGGIYPSPDGKTIALVAPKSIALMDANSNQRQTVLTYPYTPVSGESEWIFSSAPVWATDSQSFMIAIPQLNYPELPSVAHTKIWRISIETSSAELMSQIDVDPYLTAPVISPDLAHVIYQPANTEDAKINELRLATIDLTNQAVVYEGKSIMPWFVSWLPNSDHYVMTFLFPNQEDLLGDMTGNINPLDNYDIGNVRSLRWLDSRYFLTVNEENELILGILGDPVSIPITDFFSYYDVYDFVH